MALSTRNRAPNGGTRNEDWDVAVTQLDGRVGAIEASLATIMGELRGLSSKMEDRGRPQWAALGVLISFMTVVGGLVYYPIQQSQARSEASITHLAETAVSKEDFTLIISANKERRDDNQRVTEQRFARVEGDIDKMQSDIVPRGEHTQHWASIDRQFADQQRQIDETKRFESELYSARDVIRDLNERTRTLELQTLHGAPPH